MVTTTLRVLTRARTGKPWRSKKRPRSLRNTIHKTPLAQAHGVFLRPRKLSALDDAGGPARFP